MPHDWTPPPLPPALNPVTSFLEAGELVQGDSGGGVVRFATAPDGLPWLTFVVPPPDAKRLLQPIAWALDVQTADPPQYQGTPLEALADDLTRLLREQRVQRLPVPAGEDGEGGGTLEVVVLARAFRELGGPTLLERLFTERSDRTGPATWLAASTSAEPDTRATMPPATADPATTPVPGPPGGSDPGSEDRPQPKFTPGIARLALTADGRRTVIVRGERDAFGWPRYAFRRFFVEETALGVAGSSCESSSLFYPGTATNRPSAENRTDYEALRLRDPGAPWSWRVPRSAVARLMLGVVDELTKQHVAGEIHGDVKPANILFTADGVRLIDGLGLRAGARTPAMTRGWAAPEQILGRAVSVQTDQYPVGLMLLRLVGGVLFGEEARVLIPAGGTRVEVHTILRNPGVYVDPASAPVRGTDVDAWRNLIERCVRFEAEQRFGSTSELRDALRPLVEAESLVGDLEVPLIFGRLVTAAHRGTGKTQACWLVG